MSDLDAEIAKLKAELGDMSSSDEALSGAELLRRPVVNIIDESDAVDNPPKINFTDVPPDDDSDVLTIEKPKLTKRGKPDGRCKPRSDKQLQNLRKMREKKLEKVYEKKKVGALKKQKEKEVAEELEKRALKKQLKEKMKSKKAKKKYFSSSSSSDSSEYVKRKKRKTKPKKRRDSSSSASDIFKFDDKPKNVEKKKSVEKDSKLSYVDMLLQGI